MAKTTISTFQLFKLFPDQDTARLYLESRLWPNGVTCPVCNGAGAELAFAKILNAYPDLTLNPRRGGFDCVVAGTTIDVKQTHYPDGHLLVSPFRNQNGAQVYALMVGSMPTYTLAGFCTDEQLYAMQNIRTYGGRQCHAMAQNELLTLDDVRAF